MAEVHIADDLSWLIKADIFEGLTEQVKDLLKRLKGFIKKDLSHELGVYVKISLGGLNIFVTQHLFDLINGSACLQ